jgi:energy-coupling factor transporter ATP-binding protein EcfA2
MYKYEQLSKEIIEYLKQQKKAGNKTFILNAKDVEHIFNVSERCGAAKGQTRYPLICQAMTKVTDRFQGTWIDGKNPSSTYTVEYRLALF